MLRTIIFKILLSIYFVLWSPLLFIGLINKRLLRIFLYGDAYGVLVLARLIAGIKWKINGHYKGGIIAAKHMSILEISMITISAPNVFFVIKRELMWFPIYGWAFARLGMMPVNRGRGKTNMKKLTVGIKKRINSGMTFAIFPEGTRAKPGAGVKLKRGILMMAQNLQMPIQPVGTDSGLYWPKHGAMKSGTANIYYEEVLPFDADLETIANSIGRRSA